MADASESEKSQLPMDDSEQLELKLPDESAEPKDLALWAGVLALLTLIAFWPATTGTFLWRDDAVANANLLSPAGLASSWLARWQNPSAFKRPIYQPVADSAYWLEYRLGGHNDKGLPTPTSFHIASLIFHVGSAILLWLILRELLMPGGWLIAAIFTLHPLHAEPVAWVSEQPVVLCGMLFLASVYAYLLFVKYREQDAKDRAGGGSGVDPAQTWGIFAGAIVLAVMAMLSEPSALLVPVVIAILLVWRKRFVSQDGLFLSPLLLIGLVLWFLNLDLHKTGGEAVLVHAPFSQFIGATGHAFWNLLFHWILPLRFSVLYLHGDQSSMLEALALLAVVVLCISWFVRNRVGQGWLVAVAVTIALVVASLNWFDPTRLAYVTDGDAYLAIIPLIAVAVVLVSKVRLPGPGPQTVVGVSAFVLIVLGGLSLRYSYAFQSSVALWTNVSQKDPQSSFAQASLAEQLRLAAIDEAQAGNDDAVKQDLADSVDHAQKALDLDPGNAKAQGTWANVLVSQGDIAKSVSHFEQATRLDPNDAGIRNKYGSALIELGRFKESLPPLNQALALDVTSGTAHALLGQAYAGMGDMNRAIHEESAALELDSGDLVARQKLAEIQTKAGQYKEAITNYSLMMQADQAQMQRADLWIAIARIKDTQHQYEPAVKYLETAVQLDPDNESLKKELDAETKKQAAAVAATMPSAARPATPAAK